MGARIKTHGIQISGQGRHRMGVVGLRPVDRVLGALFGLFRGLILLLALSVVVQMLSLIHI